MLDAAALRELLSKQLVGPAAKREAVAHLAGRDGPVGASGLPHRRPRPQDDPLPVASARRSRAPRPATRNRQRTASLRLPKVAHSAAAGRASPRASTGSTASIREEGLTVRKRLTASCCRRQGADPGLDQALRAMVVRLRPRPVCLWPTLPRARHRRRRDARVPGGDSEHLDLRPARLARADGSDLQPRQARRYRLRPRPRVHLERHPPMVK